MMLGKVLNGDWDSMSFGQISKVGSFTGFALAVATQGIFVASKLAVKRLDWTHTQILKHVCFGRTSGVPFLLQNPSLELLKKHYAGQTIALDQLKASLAKQSIATAEIESYVTAQTASLAELKAFLSSQNTVLEGIKVYLERTPWKLNYFTGVWASVIKEAYKGAYKTHAAKISQYIARYVLSHFQTQVQKLSPLNQKLLNASLAGVGAGFLDALASQGPDRIVTYITTTQEGENGLLKHFQQFKGRPGALFHDLFVRGFKQYACKQMTTFILMLTYDEFYMDYAQKHNIDRNNGWNKIKSALGFGIFATFLTTPLDALNTWRKMNPLEGAASETALKGSTRMLRPYPYLCFLKMVGSFKQQLLYLLFKDNPNYQAFTKK